MSAQTKPQSIVVERVYRARPQELWDLWTTKVGFESWWGPQGFRVEVHAIEPRVGGHLSYDMIAATPEMVAAMKDMGQPASHKTHGAFTVVEPLRKLTITHVIDFLPGVKPYDSTMTVEFFAADNETRMVVTLTPMHSEEFTKMSIEGFTSQLSKLDERFKGSN